MGINIEEVFIYSPVLRTLTIQPSTVYFGDGSPSIPVLQKAMTAKIH